MKHKIIAVVLALASVSWAQTATQTAPAAPQQSTTPDQKAQCPCCNKMASANEKDAPSCCAHHDMKGGDMKDMASCCSGKDATSCCGGKDAKSCMKNTKDAAGMSGCCAKCGKDAKAASCCGGKCGKDAKGCCSSPQKTDKPAGN